MEKVEQERKVDTGGEGAYKIVQSAVIVDFMKAELWVSPHHEG